MGNSKCAVKNSRLEESTRGKSKLLRYEVRSDSEYELAVEFDSGKTLTSELGPVTSGEDFKDILTVTDHEVSLTRLTGK